MSRIEAILNPKAGPDSTVYNAIERVLREAGIDRCAIVGKDGSLDDLIKAAIESGADRVLVAGGDGTQQAAAAAFSQEDIGLGVIPSGSANVFATALGIPANPIDAARALSAPEAQTRLVDLGEVNGERFLVRFGLGWHAAMTLRTPSDLKARLGRWAYPWNALRIRMRLKHVTYRLKTDGEEREERGVCCIVANTGHLGAGELTFSPEINLTSGRLHVLVVRRASWKSVLAIMARVLASPLLGKTSAEQEFAGELHHWPASRVLIDCDPGQIAAFDGESYEGEFPAVVQVLPGALRVIVPE